MLQKIKSFQNSEFYKALGDVRNIGLLAFGVIALLVTWSGIKVVQTNYDLQKQISAMQQQNEVKRLENGNMALQNQYLQSDQYLELAARRHFNKAAPGEKLLIVPKSVALAHTVDIKIPSVITPEQGDVSPWYEKNFNAWLDFLLHRPQS
jgi:cell division protein FtsB